MQFLLGYWEEFSSWQRWQNHLAILFPVNFLNPFEKISPKTKKVAKKIEHF
jgi:hypothetical protein